MKRVKNSEFDGLYPLLELGFAEGKGGEFEDDNLLKLIEDARANMHQLVDRFGITDPQVLQQSQMLDFLLNIYHLMKAKKYR